MLETAYRPAPLTLGSRRHRCAFREVGAGGEAVATTEATPDWLGAKRLVSRDILAQQNPRR